MTLSRIIIVLLLGCFAVALAGAADLPLTLTFDKAETAGMCGMRPFWDRPVVLREDGLKEKYSRGDILVAPRAVWASDLDWHAGLNYWIPANTTGAQQPGAIIFDAVHRSLLVRFPGVAKKIADAVNRGYAIENVALVLPFNGAEKAPRGYKEPSSFIGNIWDTIPPRWHAVAWTLRKPWFADLQHGPTFNAYVNGIGYWKQYGAQDTTFDRYPQQFGPAEVSQQRSETLDVTPVLTNPAYGKTLSERLCGFEDCGFIVRKLETYDFRYITPGYEWATMTGGLGIFVKQPKLIITLKKDPRASKLDPLPPSPDLNVLIERLQQQDGLGGQPTAVMPSDTEFAQLKEQYRFQQPETMPDWQWQRVQELYRLGGLANTFPETREEYEQWIDRLLATPPRSWEGFSASEQLTLFYTFEKALPAPVIDHWKLYWAACLMPQRKTETMVHNLYQQIWTPYRGVGSDYYDKTGDWRGNSSFYRESYTRYMSTMNFNHTSALGALLGGHFIDSKYAEDDGRYGLEMFPLRLWSWYDGTTQESIDHYYFAITLIAQKMFADFGPTPLDRMMGRSALTKSVEELAGCYHPNLRRFISTSGRTGINYLVAQQDGLQHILHTLSPAGTLTDLGKKEIAGIPVIGHDLPPGRVAQSAVSGPWAPEWMAGIIDNKPLPFEMTTTFKQWGSYWKEPRFKKSYLGHSYGMASIDLDEGRTVPVMAQWNRLAKPATSALDLGTLILRYGMNTTNLLDTQHTNNPNGVVGIQGGNTAVVQHRNKMVVLTSPYYKLHGGEATPKEEIRSLQTTIGLLSLQQKPTWTLYVDGKPVMALPAHVKASTRITLKDGVSYLGIIPISATDLGRDEEIVIKDGGQPVDMQGGGKMKPALIIESYNYKRPTPLDNAKADWDAIDRAYGGFIIEMADTTEYKQFADFQRHITQDQLELRWEAANETLHLALKSGKDTLELGYRPRQHDGPDDKIASSLYFPYRRVNGRWPYLSDGIERETTLSVQGRSGRLEKGGAVLTNEPGMMGYLLTEPHSGTFAGANPLPDATYWSMTLPTGARIDADGKVSMLNVTAQPAKNTLRVDYAATDAQNTDDMATALLVSGWRGTPAIIVNGTPLQPDSITLNNKQVLIIPLLSDYPGPEKVSARFQQSLLTRQPALSRRQAIDAVLQYEPKQEHYLLTVPRSGMYRFQRLWPAPSVLAAHVPGGLRVATDGRVALLRLDISKQENTIDTYIPPYAQNNFTDRAHALLIFGADTPPTLILNGEPYAGKLMQTQLNGETVYVAPLFEEKIEEVLKGLPERYVEAQKRLENR